MTVTAPERLAQNNPAGAAITLGLSLAYGGGMLGVTLLTAVPSLLLLFYATNILGLPASIAGLAIFIPKAAIVFVDPAVGYLSDRARTRWGRRRPFMLVGGLLAAIMLVILFSVPNGSRYVTFAVLTLSYLIYSTAMSVFVVPYFAMAAEMTDEPHARTRLLAWRMGFGMGGIILAGAAAPLLVQAFGDGRPAYHAMACVLAGVCGLVLVCATLGTHRARFSHPSAAPPFLTQAISVARDAGFVWALCAYALQTIASGAVTAMIPYYVRYRLEAGPETITVIFLTVSVVGALAMGPWLWLSRKVRSSTCFRAAVLLFALGLLSFAAVPAGAGASRALLLAFSALTGIGLAGVNLFNATVLPAAITRDEIRSGIRRGALYSGVWTAMEKVALATGALVSGIVLQGMGFIASTNASQPQSVQVGVLIGFTVIPATLALASLWPLAARDRVDLRALDGIPAGSAAREI